MTFAYLSRPRRSLRCCLGSGIAIGLLAAAVAAAPPERPAPKHTRIATTTVAVADALTPLDLFFLNNEKAPFTVSIATQDGRGGYVEGERFKVVVTASEEVFVTVIAWGAAGEMLQLVPSPAVTGSTEPIKLGKGERLEVPKGGAAFKAEPPHGETNLRVFASKEPLTLDLPLAGAPPKETPAEPGSGGDAVEGKAAARKLFGGGTKGIGVEEAPKHPLEGTDWAVADAWVMTGSSRKDLAERMGLSEEAAVAPIAERPAEEDDDRSLADRFSDLLLEKKPVERPARKNPLPPLTPVAGNAAVEEYLARWQRVLKGESATKSIGGRLVPARPLFGGAGSMPRVSGGRSAASDFPSELLVVRTPPKGSKSIPASGYTTERVPLVPPGSKSLITTDEALQARITELLAADPTIRTVIPNRTVQIFGAAPTADDNLFRGLQWHLSNEAASDHDIRWFLKAVDLVEIKPVLIGMVDQGIHTNDGRLSPHIARNAGETPDNGIDDDGNGHVDDVLGWNFASDSATISTADDAFNHGTYCSSIIAGGELNTPGYFFPVAYDPKIVVSACVAWDEAAGTAKGSMGATIAAIQYAADRGAKVINLSLGGPASPIELLVLNEHPIFDELERKNVLLVIAAGNENIDIDANPVQPACLDRPNTIVVMATDPDGRPARAYDAEKKEWVQYSNWGRTNVDIAAPGTMILGIPNVGATSYGDGTSYATPIVTATAAILMGMHPEWDAATVKRAILESARQAEGLDDLCLTGGVLDFEAALNWTP